MVEVLLSYKMMLVVIGDVMMMSPHSARAGAENGGMVITRLVV